MTFSRSRAHKNLNKTQDIVQFRIPDKNKCTVAPQRRKGRSDRDRNINKSERRRKERNSTLWQLWSPISFDSESLSCLSKKGKANQYCHSQLQIKLSLLLLPLCSFSGHSICRNSDKRISIDCWWDQRINKWNGFCSQPLPPSRCFFL